MLLAVALERDGRRGCQLVAREHLVALQRVHVRYLAYALVQQRGYVAVGHVLFAVAERLELGKGVAQLLGRELVAHLAHVLVEGVAAAELAQHYLRLGHAHVLGVDYLICAAIGQHAVLMYARLVQKRVLAHYGLVGLHVYARERGYQLAGAHELARIQPYVAAVELAARLERHGQLLQRRVARALAYAVYRAFELPHTGAHSGQAARHAQPQVVVAVRRQHYLVDVPHVLAYAAYQLLKLQRHGIPHRVRYVHGGSALAYGRIQHAVEELRLGARGVLGRELHVVGIVARQAHRRTGQLQHLLGRLFELVAHVQIAGGYHNMYAAAAGTGQCLRGGLYVAGHGAAHRADDRLAHRLGHGLHRLKVALAAGGKARLYYLHAQPLELARYLHLFDNVQIDARRLLPIAQRRIEEHHSVRHNLPPQ